MLNTKQITETRTIEKTVSIACDICKKEYAADNYIETQEFHHIRFEGGYGSVFGDEATVECDICQHCLKKMIGDYARID